MISGTINCSTGPVGVTGAVRKAFLKDPVSHRSAEFREQYADTTRFLCHHFQVKQTYLLTGSGTLANEAMIWQIKLSGKKGLILSNGEFGERLIRQAKRTGCDFIPYSVEWGESFELDKVRELLAASGAGWLLFCHCETSTGVLNSLNELNEIADKNGAEVYVDCMSTVGTMHIDLSRVAMATCSSGKGLGSFPGLAVVMSNIVPQTAMGIPIYADLAHYHANKGVPFTISSNMVEALNTAIKEKLCEDHYELLKEFAAKYRKLLGVSISGGSSVLTFSISRDKRNVLLKNGLILSYESGYLQERNWTQLALFGKYEREELEKVFALLSIAPTPTLPKGRAKHPCHPASPAT